MGEATGLLFITTGVIILNIVIIMMLNNIENKIEDLWDRIEYLNKETTPTE